MTIPDDERNQLAMEHYQKNSWDELDAHEKRVCTGHWVGQQRSGGSTLKATSGGKKKGK